MEHPENSEEYKGLVVNKGIEQPSSVNPYLKRKPKKRQLSVAEFVEGITKGDVTILSQAVTLVESVKPEHQAVAQEVIEKCLPYSGNSIRVGISGVPGAGKSTSIDVFGLHVLEKGGSWLYWLSTRVVSAVKGVFWETRPVWSSFPYIRSHLYDLVRQRVRWAEWHARHVRRLCFVKLPDSIRFLWKPSVWDRVKRLFIRWWISSC